MANSRVLRRRIKILQDERIGGGTIIDRLPGTKRVRGGLKKIALADPCPPALCCHLASRHAPRARSAPSGNGSQNSRDSAHSCGSLRGRSPHGPSTGSAQRRDQGERTYSPTS